MRALWLVGLVVVASCKKESAAPAVPEPAADAVSELDALWKLAPEGAQLGVVVSSRGVAMIERYMVSAQALEIASPAVEPVFRPLKEALREATGVPWPALGELGLTHDKPFAAFLMSDGKAVVVVPLADRDKLLARLHGSKGADGDTFERSVCKAIDSRYICAERGELLSKLAAGSLDLARKSAGARGDLELASRSEPSSGTPAVAVAVQIASGQVIARGNIAGLSSALLAKLGKPHRPRDGAASAAGFGVFDLSPLLVNVPPVPLVAGVTADQLARSISGPVSYVIPAGSNDFGIRIPLGDPAPAKAVVEHCADIPGAAKAAAIFKDGSCHVSVPRVGIDVDVWVDGSELRIGSKTVAAAPAVAPSQLATELASREWSIALFGRGSFLDASGGKLIAAFTGGNPLAQPVLPMLPLINELGLGLRTEGSDLRFVVGIRTGWANPDDVVKQLVAITPAQMTSGQATEIARSIAAASPASPLAQDLQAGPGGMLGTTTALGITSAVIVPALMDSMKRAKLTEPPPGAN